MIMWESKAHGCVKGRQMETYVWSKVDKMSKEVYKTYTKWKSMFYVCAYKIEIFRAVSNKISRRSKDVWRTPNVKILPEVEQEVEPHAFRGR